MKSRDLWLLLGLGVVAYLIYATTTGQQWTADVASAIVPGAWLTLGQAPNYVPYLNQIEQQYGLPQNLLAAVAFQESSFDPSAVNSTSGATGMFQLLPRYYPGAGQSWQQDAVTAAQALSGYYRQFGDWQSALAAYNWGPGNLAQMYAAGGSYNNLPAETQNYVTKITANVPVAGSLVNVSSAYA